MANPLDERAGMERRQAQVLAAALVEQPERKLPLRYALTKPGDPIALRGVPLVGAAAGAIWETSPHVEVERRDLRARRIRERIEG